MAETPRRRVSFGSRSSQGREGDDVRITNDEEFNITCETSILDDQHVGSESGGNVGVLRDGLQDKQQLLEINEYNKIKNEEFHREVSDMLSTVFPELCFVKANDDTGNSMIVITQRTLMFHPPIGFTSRIQVTIRGFNYEVHVLMKKLEFGALESIVNAQELCSRFSVDSNYKFCPGIDAQFYKSYYYEAIRFNIKSVRETAEPFARVDSVNCKLWFQLASNATSAEKSAKEVQCSACKRLVTDLNCQRRRTLAESPGRKMKRQSSSSRARLTYMSPASQQKRKTSAQTERSNMMRKLGRYSELDVVLNDDQHEEMCLIVRGISDEELGKVFLEGSEHGVGELMNEVWYTDSKCQRQQFLHDQSKNGKQGLSTISTPHLQKIFLLVSGARGNRWSMITIRIGKLS